MPNVTFQPAGVAVQIHPGATLMEAARAADVPLRSDCGGQGVCGRCVLELVRGRVQQRPARRLLEGHQCLACRAVVQQEDVEVFVPEASRELAPEVTLSRVAPAPERYPPESAIASAVALELPVPSLEDNLADAERLVRRLRQWRDGRYLLPISVLRQLPLVLRGADWKPEVVLFAEEWGWRVLSVRARSGRPVCILCVDVGTTTLKARLLAPGARYVASCYNSQAAYGPDVISRILHCQRDEAGGTAALQRLVVKDINRLCEALCRSAGVEGQDVWAVVASGNTTMLHFLLGLYPVWIRREPYVGCAYVPPSVRASEVGLKVNPEARLVCLPCVSSFVGGDIVAGILATWLAERDRPAALMDLGTNGEIAVGCRDFMVCCSASAGPAFEGAGSASGTRAREGAVEAVWGNGQLQWRTVGGTPPIGICGTGYIDLLATLLRMKVLDRTGRFAPGAKGVREEDGEPVEFVVVQASHAAGGRELILTRADVENLVRAKAAIYAAGCVLLKSLGMDWKDLDAVMLAGGFGDSLNKENAVAIGLLPDLPRGRIEFVGNTSLQGAVMIGEDAANWGKARKIASGATYLELSTHPDFMEEFVSACFLPHTDAEKFPSASKWG